MKTRAILYVFLNAIFHVVHIAVILFVLIGWVFPPMRLAHLILVLLTLGSWFILGRWLGHGYCPISDWHWKIKAAFGGSKPQGTYIHLLLQNISGQKLNSEHVDQFVVMTTLAVAVISITLNIRATWF